MTTLTLTVHGDPIPQGSHRVIGSRVIPDKRLIEWRSHITAEALTAAEAAGIDEPIDAPCVLRLAFWLARPQKPRWRLPAVKPDADKLARGVCDALSPRDKDLRVLADDSRIVELHAAKYYADETHPPGVRIQIGTIS